MGSVKTVLRQHRRSVMAAAKVQGMGARQQQSRRKAAALPKGVIRCCLQVAVLLKAAVPSPLFTLAASEPKITNPPPTSIHRRLAYMFWHCTLPSGTSKPSLLTPAPTNTFPAPSLTLGPEVHQPPLDQHGHAVKEVEAVTGGGVDGGADGGALALCQGLDHGHHLVGLRESGDEGVQGCEQAC